MSQTMRAIVVEEPGGPEVLRIRDLPLAAVPEAQVRIRVKAFGLNRSELHFRRGAAYGGSFPRVPAIEAVGVVDVANAPGFAPGQQVTVIVGSANFSENVTLAYVYGQALAADGITVTYKVNIGARAAYIPALEKGEVDLIPEYAGSMLSYYDNTANQTSGLEVKKALVDLLPTTLTALEFSEAADSGSLNVTPEFATIADLSRVPTATLAANAEFETFPSGIPGLKSVYGLSNSFQAINDGGGPATLKALLDNTVQVADIYSTTPSILDNKLVTPEDPKNLFASQQVVPIVTARRRRSAPCPTRSRPS